MDKTSYAIFGVSNLEDASFMPYLTLNVCVYAGLSFISYILAEVSHGYLLEEDEQMYSEKRRRVSTFMKTPRELEKVNMYEV